MASSGTRSNSEKLPEVIVNLSGCHKDGRGVSQEAQGTSLPICSQTASFIAAI